MSIEPVMPSNHPILCLPLLFSPSIFPSIRVFSSESAVHIRWPGLLTKSSLNLGKGLHLPLFSGKTHPELILNTECFSKCLKTVGESFEQGQTNNHLFLFILPSPVSPLGCVKPKPGTILAKSQSRIHSCALLVLRPNWEAVMKLAGRGYGDRHKQTTCPAGRLNREPQLIGPEVCLEALATPESSIVPATPVDALSPETGEWEGNQPGWRRHHEELQAWWESRAHGSVAQMGFEPLSWEF